MARMQSLVTGTAILIIIFENPVLWVLMNHTDITEIVQDVFVVTLNEILCV